MAYQKGGPTQEQMRKYRLRGTTPKAKAPPPATASKADEWARKRMEQIKARGGNVLEMLKLKPAYQRKKAAGGKQPPRPPRGKPTAGPSGVARGRYTQTAPPSGRRVRKPTPPPSRSRGVTRRPPTRRR